jgi:hypothetical protein
MLPYRDLSPVITQNGHITILTLTLDDEWEPYRLTLAESVHMDCGFGSAIITRNSPEPLSFDGLMQRLELNKALHPEAKEAWVEGDWCPYPQEEGILSHMVGRG